MIRREIGPYINNRISTISIRICIHFQERIILIKLKNDYFDDRDF